MAELDPNVMRLDPIVVTPDSSKATKIPAFPTVDAPAEGGVVPAAYHRQGDDEVGAQADDNSLHDEFSRVRSAPGLANDSWMRALEGAPAAKTPAPGIKAPPPPAPGLPSNAPMGARILHGIAATSKDIAIGATEAPAQIVGGLIDYGNNIMKFADDVVAHAEHLGVPNVYAQMFNKQGKWDPQIISGSEYRAGVAAGTQGLFQIPTVGHADTVTGNIVRGITTFIAARSPASALAKGSTAGGVAVDALAGATGMDPNEKRLSNLVDDAHPNFISDWLKVKPEDEGTFLGRLKSGMEYAGMSTAIIGTLKMLKYGKDALTGTRSSLDAGAGTPPGTTGDSAQPGGTGAGAADPAILHSGRARPPTAEDTALKGDIDPALGDEELAANQPANPQESNVPEQIDQGRRGFVAGTMALGASTALSPMAALQKALVSPAAAGLEAASGALSGPALTGAQLLIKTFKSLSSKVDKAFEKAANEADVAGDGFGGIPEIHGSGDILERIDKVHEMLAGTKKGELTVEHARKVHEALEDLFGMVDESEELLDHPGVYKAYEAAQGVLEDIDEALNQEPWASEGGRSNAAMTDKHLSQLPAMDADRAALEAHDSSEATAERMGLTGTPAPEATPPIPPVPEATPPVLLSTSPPTQPQVTVSTADKLAATDFLAGRPGMNPVKINLDRIGSAQDIKDTLAQISTQLPKNARQDHDTTIALAQQLGLNPADFLKGYKGAQLNSVETTAMRFMLDSSARQVADLAIKATDINTGSPAAMATFIKAFSVHRAIQQYAENAANEAGRTLNAWGIMSRETSDNAKMIQKIIDNVGEGNAKDVASKIAELSGDPAKVSAFIGTTARNTGHDGFMYGYYNVLLSNPAIVIKKLASDAIMGGWNVAARYAAEKFGAGADGGVAPGEAAQLLHGYIGSFTDGVRAAGLALKHGESQFQRQYSTLDAMHTERLNAMTDSAPASLGLKPTGAWIGYLKGALPTGWIGAADDFAKVINYRASLRALSYRDGVSKGFDGDELASHIRGMAENPTEALHDQAVAQSLANTFQEPLTGIGLKIQNAADAWVWPVGNSGYTIPAGRIIAPFIKIPTNIARWSYNNSPLPMALPTDNWKAFMSSSKANHDIGMAKIGLGTALGLTIGSASLNGYITGRGPSDPEMQRAWRAAGYEPYSIKNPVDGKWYGYNSIEPTGMYTACIADTFNIMRFAHDDDRQSLAVSAVMGVGQAALSKSYLSGTAALFEAMNDPERKSTGWFDRLAAGMLAPSAGAALRRAQDPFMRQHYDLMDAIENRLPYLSQGLPPARTLWGDAVPLKEGFLPPFSDTPLARAVSPVPKGPVLPTQPIDKWIWENREAFPSGPDGRLGITKPGRFITYDSGPHMSAKVELEPKEHDRYQVLAGNGAKDPVSGLGARDFLNALIAGNHPTDSIQNMWNDATPTAKSMMVLTTIGKFRTAAKEQLRAEFPRVSQAAEAGLQQRQNALTPQGN